MPKSHRSCCAVQSQVVLCSAVTGRAVQCSHRSCRAVQSQVVLCSAVTGRAVLTTGFNYLVSQKMFPSFINLVNICQFY